MASILKPRRKIIPSPARLSINRNHPLSRGLIGAYIPGISPNDYTGLNGPFGYAAPDIPNGGSCTGISAISAEGPSVVQVGGAHEAMSTAAGAVNKAITSWTTQISYYLRFNQIATSTNSTNGQMFVADWTNFQVAAGIAQSNSTSATNATCLAWGGFSFSALGATWAVGIHGILVSVNVSPGTSTMWLDGATTYLTSTSMTAPGGTPSLMVLTLGLNDAQALALYFWDHALTQQEAMFLEADPYGIFQSTSLLIARSPLLGPMAPPPPLANPPFGLHNVVGWKYG